VNRVTTVRIGLLALIWGSGFLWIKLAIRGLSPVEVTLARLVLGSAVAAGFAAGPDSRVNPCAVPQPASWAFRTRGEDQAAR
jgi:hypothetical protein